MSIPAKYAYARFSISLQGVNHAAIRVTLKDVAERAAVSPTTASHALNNKGNIAESTKARVLLAASELGYRPNAIAQGLRTARLGIISLVMRPLDSLDTVQPEGVDYFLRFTGAAALAALQHGYTLMLITDPRAADAPASSLMADGCIIADPIADDPVITFLHEKRIPLVTVGVDPERPDAFPSIGNDTREETLLVLDHLEESGGTRFALVTGTDPNDWNTYAKKAYTEWCTLRGQAPVMLSFDETLGVAGGIQAMREIASSAPDIDAVYSLTGRHAAGITQEAIRLGYDVPEDLLVASGSDSEQTRTMTPGVTSLDLLPADTATVAVERLISLLDQPDSGAARHAPGPAPQLIVRESTTRTSP